MHISYESGILENPNSEPPSDLFLMTRNPSDTPDKKYRIEIEFTRGFPVLLRLEDGSEFKDKLEIFTTLNKLAGDRGIGRIDIVENRFIGLKVNLFLIRNEYYKIISSFQSRGVYETPAGYILHIAHLDLELFCLDKEVYRLVEIYRNRLSDYVYNGFWFSPEGNYARKCIALAEENVTGTVKLELYKGQGDNRI